MISFVPNNRVGALILLRYALIPCEFAYADEGHHHDEYDFIREFKENSVILLASLDGLLRLENENKEQDSLFKYGYNFIIHLPYVEGVEEVTDCEKIEIISNWYGSTLNPFSEKGQAYDEASIFYLPEKKIFYEWFNQLNDKTVKGLLLVFRELLVEFVSDNH